MSKAVSSLGLAAGLAVILATGAVDLASAKNRTEMQSSKISITLRVYDYVRVNRPVLLAAEGEASAILAQAGLELRWVDCQTSQAERDSYPDCQSAWQANDFVLRALPKTMADLLPKGQDALGSTPECDGVAICTTSIFYDRVNSHAEGVKGATVAVLLGRTMAHEIGHLLLGENSHAQAGIMRAFWSGQDLTLGVCRR